MNKFVRYLILSFGWVCFFLGCVGVVVPVLPTTPFLLLATFIFARTSLRCHEWICGTKIYKKYVASFKEAGGMPIRAKVKMMFVSYIVLLISGFVSQKPFVWAILAIVALFLLWLVTFRIPTVSSNQTKVTREELLEK